MEEYNGELPQHVVAQIEEHTAGGFILFRIGSEGDILNDMKFDNETFYLALVKKATSVLLALNSIDNTQALRALSDDFDPEAFVFEEDEDEDDDYEDSEESEDEN